MFLAYTAAARIGLFFILEPTGIAAIWPPTGLAVGVMLVAPAHRRPWVLLGIAASTVVANATAGIATPLVAGFVVANLIGPVVATVVLERLGFASLARLRGVWQYIFVAALLAPALSGLVGAGAASAFGGSPFLVTWVMWLVSNAGAILAFGPLVLVAAMPRPIGFSWRRASEASVLGILLIGLLVVTFGPFDLPIQLAAYPIFLFLVVAGVRFGLEGAAITTYAVSLLAIAGTIAHHGPIAGMNTTIPVQIGQAHMLAAVAFLTSFVSAAAMAERRVAAEALEQRLETERERSEIGTRVVTFAREISDALESDALFQRIVKASVAALPADIAILTIATPEDPDTHRIVAAVGAPNAIGRPVVAGDGVTGAAIRDRALVYVDGLDQVARASSMRDVMPDVPVAVAAAPVAVDGAIGAVLSLARLDPGASFGADELQALEMMTGMVAVALRNSREFGRVQDSSIRDELTGVPNRRYFTTSFEQLTAHRLRQTPEQRGPISVLMFDLDHFGAVNKERGHATGDRVLAEFGSLLATRLRKADIVARYGGEEFVAILVGTPRSAAMAVADEIRTSFESATITGADGSPIRCTVSVGVATAEPDEGALDGLLPAADVALSMAKRAGRNMVAAA